MVIPPIPPFIWSSNFKISGESSQGNLLSPPRINTMKTELEFKTCFILIYLVFPRKFNSSQSVGK